MRKGANKRKVHVAKTTNLISFEHLDIYRHQIISKLSHDLEPRATNNFNVQRTNIRKDSKSFLLSPKEISRKSYGNRILGEFSMQKNCAE
jgi:hypothetical protein